MSDPIDAAISRNVHQIDLEYMNDIFKNDSQIKRVLRGIKAVTRGYLLQLSHAMRQ